MVWDGRMGAATNVRCTTTARAYTCIRGDRRQAQLTAHSRRMDLGDGVVVDDEKHRWEAEGWWYWTFRSPPLP